MFETVADAIADAQTRFAWQELSVDPDQSNFLALCRCRSIWTPTTRSRSTHDLPLSNSYTVRATAAIIGTDPGRINVRQAETATAERRSYPGRSQPEGPGVIRPGRLAASGSSLARRRERRSRVPARVVGERRVDHAVSRTGGTVSGEPWRASFALHSWHVCLFLPGRLGHPVVSCRSSACCSDARRSTTRG